MTTADGIEIGLLAVILVLLARRSSASSRPAKSQHGVILDSCALIDGRISELAAGGFVEGPIIIPQFILHELQLLADGGDGHKRARARFGLDVAQRLQEDAKLTVLVDHTDFAAVNATDHKLVALAKKRRARLYTTDFNLNKVAAVEGVSVLNVNELAQSLRPALLPGETVTIKIVQKGDNPGQGVGYLDDGTMLVVDHAARLIGKTVQAKIVRMHQTVAGKMAFATLAKPAKK